MEEWLPGAILKNEEDIVEFIKDVACNKDVESVRRNKLKKLFHDNCSGSNCERLLAALNINKD